jgi:hypothetical protein
MGSGEVFVEGSVRLHYRGAAAAVIAFAESALKQSDATDCEIDCKTIKWHEK